MADTAIAERPGDDSGSSSASASRPMSSCSPFLLLFVAFLIIPLIYALRPQRL